MLYYQLKNDFFLKFGPGRWFLLNQSYVMQKGITALHKKNKKNRRDCCFPVAYSKVFSSAFGDSSAIHQEW